MSNSKEFVQVWFTHGSSFLRVQIKLNQYDREVGKYERKIIVKLFWIEFAQRDRDCIFQMTLPTMKKMTMND